MPTLSHGSRHTDGPAAYSGATVRLARDLSVLEANEPGDELIARCGSTIRAAAHRAFADGAPTIAACEMDDADATRDIELTLIPSVNDVLVLGRDCSLERRMHTALVESRRRYQDLVAISGDFAWETDVSGAFVFVSPKGALGYSAAELIGRQPTDLIGEGAVLESVACFTCRSPVQDIVVWLSTATGDPVCLSTSAIPVLSDAGWAGARGICRDVTEEMTRSAELANIRLREQTAAFIADRMRNEIYPQDMLEAAVSALGRALGAAAAVFTTTGDNLRRAAVFGSIPRDIDNIISCGLADDETYAVSTKQLEILARATSYRGKQNGAVVIARAHSGASRYDNERQLLEATARQLGIALRQIQDQRELYRLSNTDALTGLLNRRAFDTALSEAIAACQAASCPAALIYVDLDNFKPINDQLGHAEGDATLKSVADVLAGLAVSDDFVARLGGDEFALWCGQVGLAQAERVASKVLAEIERLGKALPASDTPLGASIGVAMLDPTDGRDGTALLSRADGAMYQAKHGGKGRCAIAAPPARADR